MMLRQELIWQGWRGFKDTRFRASVNAKSRKDISQFARESIKPFVFEVLFIVSVFHTLLIPTGDFFFSCLCRVSLSLSLASNNENNACDRRPIDQQKGWEKEKGKSRKRPPWRQRMLPLSVAPILSSFLFFASPIPFRHPVEGKDFCEDHLQFKYVEILRTRIRVLTCANFFASFLPLPPLATSCFVYAKNLMQIYSFY